MEAESIGTTSVSFVWGESTDNVEVVGYNIYLDDVLIDTVTDLEYQITGLDPDTAYVIGVSAVDAADNESDITELEVTTRKPQTLLFVTDSTSLGANDTAKKAIFEALGWTVTVIAETTAEPSPVTQSVVFISETVSAANLGTKYKSVPNGLILEDRSTTDDLGFSNTNGTAASPTTADVNIIDVSHPITTGLSTGNYTVLTAARQMTVCATTGLGPGASVLARHPSVSTAAMLFTYNPGDTMDASFVAPGRRVMIPLHQYVTEITANGQYLLIEQTLRWCAEYI